jgi:hypothetical protein
MKACTLCRRSREISDFNRKRASPDGLQNVCRDCNRAQAREYYARNREAHVRTIMQRKAEQRRIALDAVADHLLTHPCADCGEADVRVLDFDHRVGTGKQADVMRLVQHGYSLARITAEIAKCDVRCRNCHAKVTYERMGDNWRSRTQSRRAPMAGDAGAASGPSRPTPG